MPNEKVALVTGANQGVGFQIARDLAAKGFTVLISARDLAKGEKAAKAIDGDARAIQLDITDPASIGAAATRIAEDFARDLAKGEKAASSIGGDAQAVQLDVTDQASIVAAEAHILNAFERLDVLVNNAGIVRPGSSSDPFPTGASFNDLTKAPLDIVREVWETNVFGVIAVMQAMLPLLRETPSARIVNIGSTGGSLA